MKEGLPVLKLIKRMRRREAFLAILCILAVASGSYFELKLPDYMSDLTLLINQGPSASSQIGPIALQMLLVVLISACLTILSGYLSARCASGFTYSLREDEFKHVISLDQEHMLSLSIPSLITLATNDITQVQMITSMGLSLCVKAPTMAVWALVKILGRSGELSLLTAAFVVALCGLQLAIMLRVIPRIRIVQKLMDKINLLARENLSGINVVHAFNAEQYQIDKFNRTNLEMNSLQIKNQKLFAIMGPSMTIAMNGLSLSIYWVGALLIRNIAGYEARLNFFSNVVVFSSYAMHVIISFSLLIMIFMMLPAAQVSAERINEVLDTKATLFEGTRTDTDESGTLEFRDVSFRYAGAAEDALQHVSFTVRRGQTLAIIGATGSGKSTLVSLIARFYDATAGQILLDGVNIRELTFEALYNKLGYITQKAVLFSGTVRENIAFGEKEGGFTDEAVRGAIEISQAAEFVDKLEGGEDYVIAQAGRNVSGGQKQRLSIARALARTPEVLVFDDSFSALDYATDARLRGALKEKAADSIRVIVAQRIGTVRDADQILVLDEGRVVGQGTHGELLKNCSVYREIAQSQLSAEELA